MAKMKSIAELRKELASKEQQLDRLKSKRAKVAGELERLDKQIADLSGKAPAAGKSATRKRAPKKRRRRPRNKAGLADTLAQVLEGKTGVGIDEAADLVRKVGYKSHARRFRALVGKTLSQDDRFKSVGRGVYGLKG